MTSTFIWAIYANVISIVSLEIAIQAHIPSLRCSCISAICKLKQKITVLVTEHYNTVCDQIRRNIPSTTTQREIL